MELENMLSLVGARRGHFTYESGHHGDLWLDLETLCLRPMELRPYVNELASRLTSYKPQVVCGPMVEGAFVALMVAQELGCEFVYANRFAPRGVSPRLFSVEYRLPVVLRSRVKDKRVVIVNDVISAGSAVRGAHHDLVECGAMVAAVGSLMVMGESFREYADANGFAMETLARMPHNLWTREECPLCAKGVAVERLAVA